MPWPFRRSTPNPPSVAGGNGTSSGGGSAGDSGAVGAAGGWGGDSGAAGGWSSGSGGAEGGVFGGAGVRAAWEDLPPLQRSTEDLTPVAPAASFRESLSAHQDPRFLAPLGHSLTVDAPSGEIGNYAQPAPVEQRQEFTLPPSAANFSTAGSGAGAPVQRATEELAPVQRTSEGLAPVQRTSEGLAPVQRTGEGLAPIRRSGEGLAPFQRTGEGLAPVQRATDVDAAPVARTFSLPSAMTLAGGELQSDVVSAGQLPSIEPRPMPVVPGPVVQTHAPADSSSAPDLPVVARAVESHDDHTHSPSDDTAHRQEPVEQAPLVGSAEAIGQSPFVSALGGPQGESEPDELQRSESGSQVVQRSAASDAVVRGPVVPATQRAAEVGPAIQRVVRPGAGTLHGAGSGQGAGSEQVVQRDVDGRASVEGGAHLPVNVQRAVGEQDGEVAGPLVQRGSEAQEPAQVELLANRASELGPVAQRAAEAQAGEAQRVAGVEAGGAQRAAGVEAGGAQFVQRAGDGQSVQRVGDGQVVRSAGEGPSVARQAVVQRAADQSAVQRAVEPRSEAGALPDGASAAQRSVDGAAVKPWVPAAVQRAADQSAVQRVVDVGGSVQAVGQGVGDLAAPQRPLVGELRVPTSVGDGSAAPESADGGEVVQRFAHAGGVGVQRAVEHGQQSVQRVGGGAAELLWPPPVPAVADVVVPLSSAAPLTVPGAQQTFNTASVPPAVQRVVYDHPGLRAPSSSRQATAPDAQPSAVQAAPTQVEEQVLSWSAGESFHAEPAVQRAESESVKAVSLQQMVGGYQAPASPEDVVQRDEEAAPAPAAAVPAVQAAPAQAAPAAPTKAVSAAEVEELAKRLYEPLTAKLRAELWLDRERAGRVTDRWH